MDDGARLTLKIIPYGSTPHKAVIEGRDVTTVIDEGREYLDKIRRKYE